MSREVLSKKMVIDRGSIDACRIRNGLIKDILIKAQFDSVNKLIYCLTNNVLYVFSVQNKIIIKTFIRGYTDDFDMTKDFSKIIVGGGTQSDCSPVKFYNLRNTNDYDSVGCEWALSSDYGSCEYIRFIEEKSIIIAKIHGLLYKIDFDGNILNTIDIGHFTKDQIIIANNEIVVNVNNILWFICINDFSVNRKLNFRDKIKLLKAIEGNNSIMVSFDNGYVKFLKDYAILNAVKIEKELIAVKEDRENCIIYFGNYKGQIGAIDYCGNIIFEDILEESIRDISIVNYGMNVIFCGKRLNFYVYEKLNDINISKPDLIFDFDILHENRRKIFISYCWKDKEIVDNIDKMFLSQGIVLDRDIRDLHYKQSIKEFMKRVRHSDYVLIIISSNYLKSFNCMYEITEFIKDETYKKRVLPIVLNNTDIFNINGRSKFITYWQEEFYKIKNFSNDIEQLNSIDIINELKKTENIMRELAEFLSVITDMSVIVCNDSITKDDFNKILIEIGNETYGSLMFAKPI